MDAVNEFPEIMNEARTDLAGNVSGDFSPADWELILSEARRRWEAHRQRNPGDRAAWAEVIREFHRERYWGFSPRYRPPPAPKVKQKNLGIFFVWMTFSVFVLTLMGVVWLGQIYTASDEPKDKYRFFAAIAVAILNFGYFLWYSRNYED